MRANPRTERGETGLRHEIGQLGFGAIALNGTIGHYGTGPGTTTAAPSLD